MVLSVEKNIDLQRLKRGERMLSVPENAKS